MQKIVLTASKTKKLNEILNRHSSFKRFSASRNDAYEYTATLGIRVCPYCNINYTYTVYEKINRNDKGETTGSPVCRPDLDHFESQEKAPEKLLAQENLIPACQQCNSRVKFRTKFSRKSHLHPFFDDFDSLKRFSIEISSTQIFSDVGFEIIFSYKKPCQPEDLTRADRTIKDLKLISRYRCHKVEVIDLFKKAKFYHKSKINELEELTSTANLRRHLFPERYGKINEVPLAKLKRDVIEIILKR